MLTVATLNRFPVKSCGGIPVLTASADQFGLLGDHRYMLVGPDGVFLSQRGTPQCPGTPKMALLSTALIGGQLVLSASGFGELLIPLSQRTGDPFAATIHGTQVEVQGVNAEADRMLSRFLAMECRLVTFGPNYQRRVDPTYWPAERQVHFADGFPLLVATVESLADLNAWAGKSGEHQFRMDRFRPQIVISGGEPWAEDRWKTIRIGNSILHLPKPCGRCPIVDTNQQTGHRDGDGPNRALAQFRRILRGGKPTLLFGENAIFDSLTATISVGMPVEVLAYRTDDELPRFQGAA